MPKTKVRGRPTPPPVSMGQNLEYAQPGTHRYIEALEKYADEREAERDALLEALNAGNLSGETAEIRAWCGAVLLNLERPE